MRYSRTERGKITFMAVFPNINHVLKGAFLAKGTDKNKRTWEYLFIVLQSVWLTFHLPVQNLSTAYR